MTTTRFRTLEGAGDASSKAPEDAPKVHVVTFGCQMNKYDSLLVEGRFVDRGYRTTSELEDADVVLFNTCSVREHAEDRTVSWLGELKRAKRARPDLVIGVMGCMAQRIEGDVFSRAPQVDIVCGTRRLQDLPELVDELRSARAEQAEGPSGRGARILATEMDGDVIVDRSQEAYTGGRAGFLTVMRGCDLNCTFCIVPTVRGRVKSRPIEALVDEARWMVDSGAQVVTLLGQTVNSYGEDFEKPGPGQPRHRGRQGRPSLADLVYRLQELDGLERIRFITGHPAYLTPALAEALRDCDKAERFFPLPAQAGSDRVLKAMKRGYTVDLYRRRMEMLREIVPDIELASDWIVGFPTETEEDYLATEAFLEEQGFAVNYIFKYDPRPTTHAAEELVDDVPQEVKKDRNNRLLRKSEEVALARLQRHVGQTRRVFVEGDGRQPGRVVGRTEHGLPVSFRGEAALVGTTVPVAIESATAFGMSGRLHEESPLPPP